MPRMEIPVIGIGAGPATDGQVLVFHDLLGIREGLGARFVKRYADLLRTRWPPASPRTPTTCAAAATPAPEHGYSIDPEELTLRERLVRRAPDR